ncbi:SMI1/KNR4 family protein [Jiella mangrovi]|uniref:SMI1/KNR4 family protein n=1 Tax=Jiella mangrovi TaxID=2821407 RepID=A0ABS4BHS1_9HYPH|nr:SMI1/KNR4 family protein [Jiella mangrovi]MBP0615726.1 SMI1/KNR4 family protein [Jiella mangrovi]
MTLDENFRTITDWIGAQDGKKAPAFNPPASDHQIDEAERRLGVALPPAIRRLYQLADGQPPDRISLWGAFQLVPLKDVVENAAFLNDEFPDGINVHDEDHAQIDVPPEIRAVWWSRGWIPIMENGGGDHVCVDLDPAEAGTPGQLLTYYHDETYRPLVASDMEALLRHLAERLRSGACRIDEHGLIEGAD